jgi:hypothetical protein
VGRLRPHHLEHGQPTRAARPGAVSAAGRSDELRSNLGDDTFRAEATAADLNGTNIFVGEAVGLIHDMLPAATILRRMALEAADMIRLAATRIGRM